MAKVRSAKKAVNVSISAELLQAARNSDINLSATLEAAVAHEVRLLRRRDHRRRTGSRAHQTDRPSTAGRSTFGARRGEAMPMSPRCWRPFSREDYRRQGNGTA